MIRIRFSGLASATPLSLSGTPLRAGISIGCQTDGRKGSGAAIAHDPHAPMIASEQEGNADEGPDATWQNLRLYRSAKHNSSLARALYEKRENIMPKNRQILLASRPRGEPTRENFKIVESEIPQTPKGGLLLKTLYLSLDPYMRGRMSEGASYAKATEIGEVMTGGTVSEVIESDHKAFARGDI